MMWSYHQLDPEVWALTAPIQPNLDTITVAAEIFKLAEDRHNIILGSMELGTVIILSDERQTDTLVYRKDPE
jgi:hypothetical protein